MFYRRWKQMNTDKRRWNAGKVDFCQRFMDGRDAIAFPPGKVTIKGKSQQVKAKSNHFLLLPVYGFLLAVYPGVQTPALSQVADSGWLRVQVNSDQDGPVESDNALTLREAIEIVNGTLPLERLSPAERGQVSPVGSVSASSTAQSRIEFNLPPNSTTIALRSLLPPLSVPVVVDGTTQAGWQGGSGGTETDGFPRPVVALTPAPGAEVFRGLTVVSDNVTIRGLSLYGFTSRHRATASTPPADIFISHRLPPPDTSRQQPPASSFPYRRRDIPPKDVLVEYNWLGIPPVGERAADGRPIRVYAREDIPRRSPVPSAPIESPARESFFRPLVSFFERYLSVKPAKLTTTSAFGVYVFHSLGTTIRRNIISSHDGSGIITAVVANNLLIQENVLECNGFAGMPDAIRLEGVIANAQVVSNLIWDNAGSAIYLFKPDGGVQIRDNTIANNGRRYRRAAVYLMGDEHQVNNNRIMNQPGPGVVVAAFPTSDRNTIRGNQFTNVAGLSIDTVTQLNTDVHAYAVGDGANPRTESHQRRRKTGNFGIDAPRFLGREFFTSQRDGSVTLAGSAHPGATIDIYRVSENTNTRGPLNNAIATTEANEDGRFSVSIPNLEPGVRVSAIATHPQYGTSEPALNALIRALPSN
jgi:Right handed beta helix region